LVPCDDDGHIACEVAWKLDGDSGAVVVLREHTFTIDSEGSNTAKVRALGDYIAKYGLPSWPNTQANNDDADPYCFWREKLPRSLVVLSDADFSFFVKTATQVVTRVALTDAKTVKTGHLWTEEALPPETLLHAPVAARKGVRPKSSGGDQQANGKAEGNETKSASEIMTEARKYVYGRMYLGGTESIGRGRVMLRWLREGT